MFTAISFTSLKYQSVYLKGKFKGEHAREGGTLRRDERIHSQCELHKNCSHRVDVHVRERVLNCVFACTECKKHWPVPDKHDCGKYERNNYLRSKTGTECFFRIPHFLLAHEY